MTECNHTNDEEILLENLSQANIFQIARETREHTHDSMDAKKLLYECCSPFDNGELIRYELLEHLRDSFDEFPTSGNWHGISTRANC